MKTTSWDKIVVYKVYLFWLNLYENILFVMSEANALSSKEQYNDHKFVARIHPQWSDLLPTYPL